MNTIVKTCARCGAERDDLQHLGFAGYEGAETRTEYWGCPPGTGCFERLRAKFRRRT